MPVDLNSLTKGWLELESDPGLFTLLLEDFGVKGVQVEEIYDLQKPIEGPVYGFIFLFKWIEERRSRRKIIIPDDSCVHDDSIVNSIFFAHQIVPNSCATHALLSVLLNCEKIYLGETLTRLKEYTYNMSPENKGYAIGNTPELARAHNSHAKPEPRRIQEKLYGFPTSRTVEAFHFVSYVPINGQLFELDGLKPFPIDHGPWGENEDWTETFRKVITERLGIATGGEPYHDIRFNLMAVVPDRRISYEQKLKTLKINRQIVLEALQQLVKVTNPQLTCNEKMETQAMEKSASVLTLNDNSNSTSSTTTNEIDVSTSAAFSQPSAINNPSSNCSTPTRMRGTSSRSASSPSSFGPLHPALYSHNYAKSPLMEGQMVDDSESRPRYEQYSGSEYSSDDEDDDEEEEDDDEEDEAASPSPSHNSGQGSQSSIFPPPRLIHSGPGSGCPLAPNTTSPIPLRPIHVNTKDFSKPLSIQTKFETSPTPSCSSTDTSSEVGSAFNSPVRSICFSSAQNSPNFNSLKDFKRFVVIRVSGSKDAACEESPDAATARKGPFVTPPSCVPGDRVHHEEAAAVAGSSSSASSKRNASEVGNEAMAAAASKRAKTESLQPSPRQEVSSSTSEVVLATSAAGVAASTTAHADSSAPTATLATFPRSKESPKYPQLIEPHTFAPKDLLALLKNIETEIATCESTLKDEIEKQNKYRIDDCRRTHNYDNFICTFLSMLEGHSLLTDLVEQHMIIKRRQGINIGRLHKVKKVERKRKARAKRRK